VIHEAKPVGNATGLRAGAIILWVVAFIFEILAYLVLIGKINLNFMPTLWQLIVFLVLDLVCVIIGSQLWKKANHIKPASEKNKVKFWLWNNMGVIVCVICFLPIIILLLTNKDLDKKTKTIAVVVAIIALLIGGVASYDWNPVSLEQQEAAIEALGTDNVYWTPFGKVYHTYVVVDENGEVTECCPHLNRSGELTQGSVEQAIAEGRTRLCSYCARHDNITGVVTEEMDTSALEEAVEAPAA
jgi:Na+/proline symporter